MKKKKRKKNSIIKILFEYVFFSACYRMERWTYPGGYSRGGGFLLMSVAFYILCGLYIFGYEIHPIASGVLIGSSFFVGFAVAEIKEKWYKQLKKKYMYDEWTADYGDFVLLFIIIPYVTFFILTWK